MKDSNLDFADGTTRSESDLGIGTSPALAALLIGTFVGTVSNNIVNVPLNAILTEYDASLGSGIFVVVGFLLTFAAAMPLAGWVGDRFGRRRVYCGALLGTAVCSLGAALAPSLPILVAWRSLGGIAAAAFAPAVMGLIAWLFGPARRGRAVGAWAAVNGIGQAMGPSMGGVISDWWGWRWTFVPLIPIAIIGYAATMKWIPKYPGRKMTLDGWAAAALTVGAAVVFLGITAIPQESVPLWASAAVLTLGLALLVFFVFRTRRSANPFVPIHLILESRFLRSSLAAFVQMFALGSMLLAVPLYLTGAGASTSKAGLLLFVLPVTMTVAATVVGRVIDRMGPRIIMRSGLIVLVCSQIGLAALLRPSWELPDAALAAILVLAGLGIAMVQTPAAAGSTRSPAGAVGTGLGVFNLIRFGGSAVGAAWVGIALHAGASSYVLLFGVAAVVVSAGFASSFAGSNPVES
ncbi:MULTISPECIES: MFS transporter [unclassified Rhodococcus (in: high G+C Gram-positive bacteria)]|uniref:MFS transporter n=1 Tax=unclassified Rhodococcus (in: high G+C Gram-positive bacteria) TaxID=192944 RepID=UPI0033977D4A